MWSGHRNEMASATDRVFADPDFLARRAHNCGDAAKARADRGSPEPVFHSFPAHARGLLEHGECSTEGDIVGNGEDLHASACDVDNWVLVLEEIGAVELIHWILLRIGPKRRRPQWPGP